MKKSSTPAKGVWMRCWPWPVLASVITYDRERESLWGPGLEGGWKPGDLYMLPSRQAAREMMGKPQSWEGAGAEWNGTGRTGSGGTGVSCSLPLCLAWPARCQLWWLQRGDWAGLVLGLWREVPEPIHHSAQIQLPHQQGSPPSQHLGRPGKKERA